MTSLQRTLRPAQKLTSVAIGVLAALYGAPSLADGDTLQEVVVTATRRSESAQNIPASITAITGPTLERAGIVDKVDLARSLAGINVTDKGPFGGGDGSSLIIRGLNSDSTSGEFVQSSPIVQLVATYVDDTPLFFNLRQHSCAHSREVRRRGGLALQFTQQHQILPHLRGEFPAAWTRGQMPLHLRGRIIGDVVANQ